MSVEAAAAGGSGLASVFGFAALHIAAIAGTVALGVDVHGAVASMLPSLG